MSDAATSRQRWLAALCFFCAVVIALYSWLSRYAMNPDGISYLDIASQTLHGNLGALLNAYWSPLYPALLALFLGIFEPGPSGEVLIVHLLNGLIGWMSLAAFTFFIVEWMRLRAAATQSPVSSYAFRLRTGFAYALFLWGTCGMIRLANVTPDLAVAALVYLIAGLCCRLAVDSRWPAAVALGITLGLGYLAKAAMLPLGVALLVILVFRLPRRALVVAALTFMVTAGSYVLLLSHQARAFTIGESGRLNYAWCVLQEVPLNAGWVEGSAGTGKPAHPPVEVGTKPTVLEFPDTVRGTYPLWDDPAWFYQGLRVGFDPKRQTEAVIRSWRAFLGIHDVNLIPLFAGGAALFLFAFAFRWLRFDGRGVWLILWALSAFCLFGLVWMSARYVAPFVVLFWLTIFESFSPVEQPRGFRTYRLVVAGAAALIAIPQLLSAGVAVYGVTQQTHESEQIAVARALPRLGLQAGQKIATIGYPFSVYYARLAGLQVIANIGFRGAVNNDDGGEHYDSDTARFWDLNISGRDALYTQLRSIGVSAIVSSEQCDATGRIGWQPISGTHYCVRILG